MTDPDRVAPAPLRVLLVDADDRVRESLAGLLGIGDRCLVVGSAGTAGAAFGSPRTTAPDVVVVDPRLPGVDAGLRLHRRAPRRSRRASAILVLSWSDTAERTGLTAAPTPYIRKTFRPHELIDAVVSAARSERRRLSRLEGPPC